MYNIYTRTSVPQDKANTRHARFLPLSNSFDRVCLRCNLTLFTRRIKSCTGVFGLQDLASDFFRKGIFIESTQAEKYAQNSSLARNFIPGYFDRIFILSISSRVRTQRIFEMQWNNKRFSKLNNLKNISTRKYKTKHLCPNRLRTANEEEYDATRNHLHKPFFRSDVYINTC